MGHMRPAPLTSLDPRASDAELVRAVAARDESAIRLLTRRYNETLYRTARSILRDDGEAEDAVQEAYVKAIRGIDAFRADAKLSTWLVRIVANEALERLRKLRRGARVIAIDADLATLAEDAMPHDDSPAAHPEREAERTELRALMERRIDELPDAFRTVFVLRAVEELGIDEIAESLGIPEATVRTRFFRARALLRESLAQTLDIAAGDAFSFAGERCRRITEAVVARVQAHP